MKIPPIDKSSDIIQREQFYEDIIRKCENTRQERQTINDNLRRHYLFGSNGVDKAIYNKIYPHISTVSSFLYAQETTRFGVSFGADVPEEQYGYEDVLRKKISEIWHNSNTDLTFGNGLDWSLVYGSFLIKLLWNGRVMTFPLDPHMFAVLREDISDLDNQEAMVHMYYTTRSELNLMLKRSGHPAREQIMSRVSIGRKEESSLVPEVVTQIILTQTNPNLVGAANVQPMLYQYRPDVSEDLVEMRELWIYDDDLEDYRVATLADPSIVIFDRKNFFLPNEHPFIKITPKPLTNYVWGISAVQSLIGLQKWRDTRLRQIDSVLGRQLRPSRIFFGATGLTDTKMEALDREGGFFSNAMPNAKVETYKPELPENALAMIEFIDTMFGETDGLTKSLFGHGEEGVRSMEHASVLVRMASARLRKQALIVEDAIEELATLMLRLQRQEDKRLYLDDQKQPFLLSQVVDNFVVKVSAHSSTPVFSGDYQQQAIQLFQAAAIDKRTLVEMLEPPMAEMILERLKKIEASEAKIAEVKIASEMAKTVKNLRTAGR